MVLFDEDFILCQYHRNFLLSYSLENDERQLFMSNLYVIDTVGKRQAAALHEQLVRYFLKAPSSSSSRATSASFTFLKAPSSSSSRATSASFTFWKRQAAVSLLEQLVRYYFSGIQQVVVSLFEQLVCYRYFLWTTASGSLFIWATCMLLVFALDNSKRQLLYLNNLRIYNLITSALIGISPEISRRKFVMNFYLQKLVTRHQQIWYFLSIFDLGLWTHCFGSIIFLRPMQDAFFVRVRGRIPSILFAVRSLSFEVDSSFPQ